MICVSVHLSVSHPSIHFLPSSQGETLHMFLPPGFPHELPVGVFCLFAVVLGFLSSALELFAGKLIHCPLCCCGLYMVNVCRPANPLLWFQDEALCEALPVPLALLWSSVPFGLSELLSVAVSWVGNCLQSQGVLSQSLLVGLQPHLES